jgi:hypothetical protein
MKRINFLLLAIVALMACSKSSDPTVPAAAVGCTITFKGTSYPLNTATCTTNGAEQYLVGTNVGVATAPRVSLGKDTGVGDYITFFVDGSDVNTLYNSVAAPTITISGKTWTFSGTLENLGTADTGAISGTCTCAN